LLSSNHSKRIVISTEAAHSLTVSSAVEKSAACSCRCLCFFDHSKRIVISIEATHSFIVSSAEKNPAFAFAFCLCLLVVIPEGDLLLYLPLCP